MLLDAAAFAPSHRLNLTETPADFVDLRCGTLGTGHYKCIAMHGPAQVGQCAGATMPTRYACSLLRPPPLAVCSMYKLFGYPTGIGALIVRKEVAKELKKVLRASSQTTCARERAGSASAAVAELQHFVPVSIRRHRPRREHSCKTQANTRQPRPPAVA